VALGARDPERLAGFYRDVLGLPEKARHHHADGRLRSVWLDLGGAILMVEETSQSREPVDGVGRGLFLLAVCCTAEERPALERALADAGSPIEARTAHTSYARDPEGNRIAVSSL
jgi:catechol-2,3-dioxygenase